MGERGEGSPAVRINDISRVRITGGEGETRSSAKERQQRVIRGVASSRMFPSPPSPPAVSSPRALAFPFACPSFSEESLSCARFKVRIRTCICVSPGQVNVPRSRRRVAREKRGEARRGERREGWGGWEGGKEGGYGKRAKHNPADIARPPDECASCVRGATQKEGGLRARARRCNSRVHVHVRVASRSRRYVLFYATRGSSPHPSSTLPFSLFSLRAEDRWCGSIILSYYSEIGIRVRRDTRRDPAINIYLLHRYSNAFAF